MDTVVNKKAQKEGDLNEKYIIFHLYTFIYM
jgi:hypothetical protein